MAEEEVPIENSKKKQCYRHSFEENNLDEEDNEGPSGENNMKAKCKRKAENETQHEVTDDPFYCISQVVIPNAMSEILKDYSKAVLRTQPCDLLQWSYEYFTSLNEGESPKVRQQVNLKGPRAHQLTVKGLFRINEHYKAQKHVDYSDVKQTWLHSDLDLIEFDGIWKLGGFKKDKASWKHFLAIAADKVSPNLHLTMLNLCELITLDPPNGPASIPFKVFKDLYQFIVSRKKYPIPPQNTINLFGYLGLTSEEQDGIITGNNVIDLMCPPMSVPDDPSIFEYKEASEESLILRFNEEEEFDE